MATRQEVIFKGLTNSPSDYNCQDGELATCLNLINEDGALKPIPYPEVTDENITLPDGASIEFVHKVKHDQDIHSHYIIRKSDDTWYWIEKNIDTKEHYLSLTTDKINSVCSIGNILCFIKENFIIYAFWNGTTYTIFNSDDFSFQFHLYGNETTLNDTYKGTMDKEDFINCFHNSGKGDNLYFTKTNNNGTSKLFYALDAAANKKLETLGTNWFKYTVFGVAAIKLYDGTYIRASSLFTIGSGVTPNVLSFHTNSAGDGVPSIEGTFSFFKMSATAYISNSNVLNLVQSIDIFLSEGIPDVILDKEYKIDQYGEDTYYTGQSGTITLTKKTTSSFAKAIDETVLYKVLSLEKSDLGKYKDIIRPLKTEETISLASLQYIYGAKTALVYNNRLHLGNVKQRLNPIYLIKYNEAYNNFKYYDCIAIISKNENYGKKNIYINIGFPIRCNRVISIPLSNASAIFYIKKNSNTYYSYNPTFSNVENHNLSISISKNDYIDESDFQEITKSTWESIYDKYNENKDEELNISQNIVKVSEAENPLVFPAKNTVQVGSSIINALSANTRPISEGQFGEAPLYAFTDEGVWVLMTNGEGTYDARQPANREICSNPKGILQIDDAVLYPTERGIMMQQGRESICITDSLNGYPFDFTQLYKNDYAKKVLAVGNISESVVQYVRLREFLQSVDMIYDYYDNRIIVFNPNYSYAYVYSLKSKMWGTIENSFTKRVNIYPESYAINKEGKIVDVHVKEPTSTVPYFLCSRPIALSGNEVYKTMFSCIARGYFRDAASGKCGMVLYGSNDLFHWFPIKTSVHKYLRGMAGSPYKYFRIALVGSLSPDESISGISAEFQERWQNKLR